MSDALTRTADPSSAVHWSASQDAAAWTRQCVDAISEALAADLSQQQRALLLVSGGNTPLPVYRELAGADLDWQRIDIGLVDERWTAPESTGSNARSIRETLLTGRASAARFTPLVDTLDDAEVAARRASEWYGSLGIRASVAVFGIGDDGHTASLFPRSGGLSHALATADAYAAIDASGCEGAGKWPTRITLGANAIGECRRRLLLLRGATTRRVFEAALAGDDVQAVPARVLLQTGSAPLRVFWYP